MTALLRCIVARLRWDWLRIRLRALRWRLVLLRDMRDPDVEELVWALDTWDAVARNWPPERWPEIPQSRR